MRSTSAACAAAIAGLLVLAAAPGSAGEDENTAISQYCTARGDLGLSHGACVAYLEANNIVPHDAAVCRSEAIQGFLGVTSHGQCMRELRRLRE